MFTLLSECHFWTIRDEVRIKATDFGAFRYVRNREAQQHAQDLPSNAKRDYTEHRNGTVVLKNSRKSAGRLKDNIKKLEELLRMHKIVYSCWKDASQMLLLFANGIIAHICVDIYTGDILRMVYERYFVGKLAADVITDAFFTRTHIVLAYNTNQLTVVYLQKPNTRAQGPEKISHMDPRIFHVVVPGPTERKLPRHLAVNSSFDLFVIWTRSSQNEVYPWRPTIRDQDRANIHVFKIKSVQLESISYCWSENDPLCVDFLRSSESQILTVEQKVSRKGDISAEICSYEINSGKMQRSALTSVSMGTQICCYAFSPDQEKLFLGTIDRNICLHDLVLQTTKFVKQIDIIPTQCTWHCDSSVIMIANDRAQFQCFDLALSTIGNQLQSEDVTPANLLDLSHYFTLQPSLLRIVFSPKPDLTNYSNNYAQTDCFLLLVFENGPVGSLRFFSGAGMRGDIHNSGLTADVIVEKYLNLNQLEKAVNLLVALNWETYGAMCLISLHKIANHVFCRGDGRRYRIDLMAKALKTFTEALSEETKDEFSDQVFDLKRRFFFYLLRKSLYLEAFEVAQDIEDYDLFMDLYNLTKSDAHLLEFSSACFSQAAAILHDEDRANGSLSFPVGDIRSESVCSQSSCSEALVIPTNRQLNEQNNTLKNYVPPLPTFASKVFTAENIKINIPKPELRISKTSEGRRSPTLTAPIFAEACNRQLKIGTSASISTTKALVELNISSNHNKSKGFNGNWKEIPEQTVGIPTAMPSYGPSNTNNTIQRSSATGNLNPYLHYATPAIVGEPSPYTAQRNYQQVPIIPLSTYQPKFYQHPLVSGTIPPTIITANDDYQKRLLMKKPTASILSNSSATQNVAYSVNNCSISDLDGVSKEGGGGKTSGGEKNKVKFSDTVQVAVVPEISRKEKPMVPKRNGYSRATPRNLTNPKKELADSLPLCHPNDDYLKDFNPLSAEDEQRPVSKPTLREQRTSSAKNSTTPNSSIKVVHFGVV